MWSESCVPTGCVGLGRVVRGIDCSGNGVMQPRRMAPWRLCCRFSLFDVQLTMFVWRCVLAQSGSGYIVYDEGINPEKAVTDTAVRKELAVINFEYDKMGPGRMMVAVPRVNAGRAVVFKPMEQGKGIEAAIERRDGESVMFLRNKVGGACAW